MKCQAIDETGDGKQQQQLHMNLHAVGHVHSVNNGAALVAQHCRFRNILASDQVKNESHPIKTRRDSKSASQGGGAKRTRHSMTVLSLLRYPHAQWCTMMGLKFYLGL